MMTRSKQLLERLTNFLDESSHHRRSSSHRSKKYPILSRSSPDAVHKIAHRLVHVDATRAAQEHGDKFRQILQDKGMSKSDVNTHVSHAKKRVYTNHYRKAYTGVHREVRQNMLSSG